VGALPLRQTRRTCNLRGVIVMDMVGFACYTLGCQRYPTGYLLFRPQTGSSWRLRTLATTRSLSKVHSSGSATSPDAAGSSQGMLIPDTLRSDHAPFWYQGVGAVLLTDTANLRTPHYHQPSDTPATLDKPFFTGAAQIVVNATTMLRAAIAWKPSYRLLQSNDQKLLKISAPGRVAEMVAPLLKVLVLIETGTGRR